MNILYVTPYVPSQIRTRPYNLIRVLRELGHQITVLTAASTSALEQEQAKELGKLGVRVEVFPVALARSLFNCLRALPTREPLQAAFAYHPAMESRLRQLLCRDHFDVVHVEHLRAARLVSAAGGLPVVYDSVDCISLLFEQASRISPQWRTRLMAALDLRRTRSYEAWLLTRCDQVIVTSRRDKEALEDLARRQLPTGARVAHITVVTNGVDLEFFRPGDGESTAAAPTIVFTGKMSYHANVAAALFFAKRVLPRILERAPRAVFQIVGKDPPEAVQRLGTNGHIEVTGYVDDLRPYLAHATVAVCPALYAVGVQFKVLEAMAMGAPVVSTPACSGALAVEDGQQLLTAVGEEGVAAAVLRLIGDPALRHQLGAAGRRYVEAHHDWQIGGRQLLDVYEQARLRHR